MSKEQQPKRKPGSNSPNWELYSGSGKEIDYSSIYCPSLGYGPSLEYDPSLEEMAQSLQPTGTRRAVNWSRVTVEPRLEQKTEAKLTVGMSGDLNDAISESTDSEKPAVISQHSPLVQTQTSLKLDEQAKQELEQIRHELLALPDGQLLQVVIWAEAVERYRKRTGELLVDLELPTPKQPRIFLEIIRDIVALKTQLERLNPEILAQLGGRDQIIRYPSRYQQLLRIARLLEKLKPEDRDRVGVISDIYSTNLSEYEATLERAVAGLGTATPSTSGAPGANSSQTRANPLDEAQRLLFLGGEQLEQKNYQRALELFQAALKLAPNVSLIWYNIGVALGFLNRLDEALSFYERALALDNDWGQGGNRSGALNNRGDVLRRLGRFKEALQSYRQALELDPDNLFIQSNVRTLEDGILSTNPSITVPDTPEVTVNKKVVRQESPVELGSTSAGIAVNPPLLEVVPGTKVTYSFNRGQSIGEDLNRYSWYVLNDPQSVQSRRAQGLLTSEKVDGPNRAVWENATWDFPGRHTVVLEVRSPNGNITYYQYDQVVKETSEFLESAFNQIPAYDYERFRAGLEIKHLEIAQNGVSDQKVGIPYITSTAPNPARAGTAPNYARETYSVVPSPNAKGYRWYVRPENWDWSIYTENYNFNGFPRTKFQDRDVLSLESNSNSANWLITSPGVYTIICEELDASGKPLGTVAQYRQVVQDPKQFKQTEQFRQYLGQVDSDIDKIAKDKEVAIRAVYLNPETAQPMGLALFIGPDAGDPKRIKLLDLTPGASENEYGGANVEEAINDFNGGNSYPKGLIKLEIPANRKGIQSLSRTLETDGTSFLGGLASTTGWASLGLTGLGIAALVIPGAQVAVPYLFAAATAAGGISSAVSIADELQQARPSGMRIAIDIFGLASSLAVGTRAFQQIGRKGAEAAQSAGKFLIYTEFTSDAISGVLLSVEGVGQIEQILDSEGMSRSEKVTAIVRILSFLAINGGLIAYGAKDLASGGSAKPKPETGAPESANRPQNDSTPTKPAAPTSFNPIPIDPKRLQELTNALPDDLRRRVPIFADSAISGSSVRVYYQPDVSIGVGATARAVDVQLHIATARLMVRYSGLLGKIRALFERLRNWIRRNGEPRVGTIAWEAELELQKLPQVIAERQARLSQTDDAAIRSQLEAEIASFEAQIVRHEKNLAAMDTSPGKGFIAAEIDPGARNFFKIVEETSKQLTITIEQIMPENLRQNLSTKVEKIATRNTQLREAEENLYNSDNPLESVEKQIESDKKQLAADIQQLKAELFKELEAGLTSNNTRLGNDGFRELKKWHEDISATQELIELSPEFKKTYAAKMQQQQENWLLTPYLATQDSDLLYSLAKIDREGLTEIRNEVAPKLIEQRKQRIKQIEDLLKPLNDDIEIRINNLRNARGLSDNEARSQVIRGLNPETTRQIRELNEEKNRLRAEIDRIETLKNRIVANAEVEKFADNASVNDVWNRLTRNHEDGNESSTRKLVNVLIAHKIVEGGEPEIIATLGKMKYQGRLVSDVSREFKDHYRPQLLNFIYSQPTSELRYQKMKLIAESLDVQSQGSISEDWYQEEFRRRVEPKVPNTTQATLGTQDAKTQYGIELKTKENRRFDELFGDENSATIREHKHVSGKLGAEQITQFEDNIQIVQHNRRIDDKLAGGEPLSKNPQDTPVILEKDGKKFRPNKLVYTFATPKGVKANRSWMYGELGDHQEYLSFEIINSKGEIKTIDIDNISELNEPALSQWLYPATNNSKNNP